MIHVQQQPRPSIQEAKPKDVVVDERCKRTQREIHRREMQGPLSNNHLCAKRRVAIHVLDVVGDGWVRMVNESTLKVASFSLESHVFVNESVLELGCAATEKPKFSIRPIAAVLDPSPEEVVLAGDPKPSDVTGDEWNSWVRRPVACRSWRLSHVRCNFFSQRWFEFLIGI